MVGAERSHVGSRHGSRNALLTAVCYAKAYTHRRAELQTTSSCCLLNTLVFLCFHLRRGWNKGTFMHLLKNLSNCHTFNLKTNSNTILFFNLIIQG